MRLALQTAGIDETLPPQVCGKCYEELSRQVSFGTKLRVERQVATQNRINLWKNRVKLLRQARQFMAQKMFSDAAVAYEKYLRILEMVNDVEKGKLAPEHFNNSARSKELTVLTTVYWDLFRIYDTSTKYGDRMEKSGQKLAEFLRFSTAYQDIVRKAEAFQKTAKNPEIVKNFLKQVRANRPFCFIATEAFQSGYDPHVLYLRRFRDDKLKKTAWGRSFIYHYYRHSPAVSRWIGANPFWRRPTRLLLRLVVRILKQIST